MASEWLSSTIEYKSKVDGKTRHLPAGVAAVHLFNYGTHHRGQLTTLMKRAGADPGVPTFHGCPDSSRLSNDPARSRVSLFHGFARLASRAALSGARVGLVVGLGQILEVEVRVDLRAGDAGVTEELLHRTQIAR